MLIEEPINVSYLLKDKDVLLIGVDEVDQMLLRYMVEEQGANLIVENEKDAALERIRDRKYDLLIINTRLERINTLDLISKMRAAKEIRVPIIGITSRDMVGRALYNGFDYIIKRPIEKHKLNRAINEVFARH